MLLLFVCDGSGCGVQDGKTIASGSFDKSIRCVCLLSGCCVGRADRESAAKGCVEEGGRHEVQIGEVCLGSMGDTGDGTQQSVA